MLTPPSSETENSPLQQVANYGNVGTEIEEKLRQLSHMALSQAISRGVTLAEQESWPPLTSPNVVLAPNTKQPIWEAQTLLESYLGEVIVFYMESGHDKARSFLQDLLESINTSEQESGPLLIELALQLSQLFQRSGDYSSALHYVTQAYDYFKQVYSFPFVHRILEGKLFSNFGSTYQGLRQFEQAIAYWRVAECCLEGVESAEVTIPREAIAALRQRCCEEGKATLFDAWWHASDSNYRWLRFRRLALRMTAEMQRQFGGATAKGD
jgi:tetratricopeptide (TPR) repeat protein